MGALASYTWFNIFPARFLWVMLAPLRWVRRWALYYADGHHLRVADYWCGVRYGDWIGHY